MSLNNYKYSSNELHDAVRVRNRLGTQTEASIGMALDHLTKLANVPQEFQGDCDGVDALAYHLDEFTCKNSLAALNKVLQRFEELKKNT